ncbi:MAG: hypothetical protein ABIW76_16570 [Fibrobacteria bacterium]
MKNEKLKIGEMNSAALARKISAVAASEADLNFSFFLFHFSF